jgi:hypothetical protein
VQAAPGLIDDLGRRVDALPMREGQFLGDDRYVLGGRDLEDEVDGGSQFEVQFGGHDALHRSILARGVRPDRFLLPNRGQPHSARAETWLTLIT